MLGTLLRTFFGHFGPKINSGLKWPKNELKWPELAKEKRYKKNLAQSQHDQSYLKIKGKAGNETEGKQLNLSILKYLTKFSNVCEFFKECLTFLGLKNKYVRQIERTFHPRPWEFSPQTKRRKNSKKVGLLNKSNEMWYKTKPQGGEEKFSPLCKYLHFFHQKGGNQLKSGCFEKKISLFIYKWGKGYGPLWSVPTSGKCCSSQHSANCNALSTCLCLWNQNHFDWTLSPEKESVNASYEVLAMS